jgi:hypothetical protein
MTTITPVTFLAQEILSRKEAKKNTSVLFVRVQKLVRFGSFA